jgi:GntR family transcriptional regulator, arabinose operon transcriptional repressor
MPNKVPRYRQIADELKSQIKESILVPGQTLPTEPELARKYSVTRVTLRKAVDMLVTEGLVKRQQGRGTFVADNRHATHPSYLLYVGPTEEHFFKEFYCALSRESQNKHLAVAAFHPQANLSPDAAQHWGRLIARARALICDVTLWPAVEASIPAATPVLAFGRPDQGVASCRLPTYRILLDTRKAVRIATEHVLKLGHKRIAFITAGPMSGADPLLGKPYPDMPEFLGFQDALLPAGIFDGPVLGIPGPAKEDEWEVSYDAVLRHFLSSQPSIPTAFVCDADFRAARLLAVMEERGLHAPRDFSVVGLWNTPWCSITNPPLSSISFMEDEMAQLLVMLSQQPIPSAPVELAVTPRMIERASCGPAPTGVSKIN